MSGKREKHLRRVARKIARESGFTPANVWKTVFSNLRPRPKWMPGWLWAKILTWLFYRLPEREVRAKLEDKKR